jgi:hypothetical protein
LSDDLEPNNVFHIFCHYNCLFNPDGYKQKDIKGGGFSAFRACINCRALFHAELPVSCCCAAYSLCRWYCSADNFFYTADKSYKPEI